MDLSKLEAEVLKLSPGLSDEETEQVWLDEAARRDAELDADPFRARPASQVLRDARARVA